MTPILQKRKVIVALNNIINPFISSLTLIASMWFYQESIQDGYIALLLLSFVFVAQFIKGVDIESNTKTFWKKTVISLVLQWFWVIFLLLLIGFASKLTYYFSRQVLFSWFLITPGILVAVHWLSRYFVRRLSFSEDQLSKAIIVGLSDLSIKLAREFKKNPLMGTTCLGFFDDRWKVRSSQDIKRTVLGNIASVADFVKRNNIQQIYIALPMTAQPRILALLDDLRDTTASIYFVPDIFLFDLIQSHFRSIKDIPIVAVCESPFVGLDGVVKRISDVMLSTLILIMIAPLLLVIAISVKLSSPGPVLFKQRRYGLDGKEIVVYKFRSMTVTEDGDKINQATRNDPRITRLGNFLRKTSLDELPQFINVLQGHMSIVGPRPHAVSHNEIYRKLVKGYMIRHKVKPGITGWAQIKGFRGETETVQKMKSRIYYDLEYLRNWSLFLDFYIILKTIYVVIKDKNAY